MPFNGIHNLRDANERVTLKPWQIQEIKRCAKDPIYFIRHYVYINTKDFGMQLMKTYPFQDAAIMRFLKYRFNINRWSRQVGKSTVVRAFILWYAMFHQDKLVAMLANKLMLAKEQLQLLRESYIALPFWLQPGVKLWNKMSIQFSNGCRIMVSSTSPDGIRGFSPNLLYLDEFAFLRPGMADEFMASVMPTISSGKTTRIIITSCVTPDTIVYTNKGMQEIGEFINPDVKHGGYEVPDYKVCGFNAEMNNGKIFHTEGITDTIKLTTTYGTIEGSTVHKYYGCKNGEFRIYKANELAVGDWVAMRYGMECWGDDRIDYIDTTKDNPRANNIGDVPYITEDIAYLFGLYIAEGTIFEREKSPKAGSGSSHSLSIACGDDITPVLKQLGLHWYLDKTNVHYSISSKSLIDLFHHVGFDIHRHAPAKIIPARLMQMSRNCTAAMLQGMYDGDGCADNIKHYRIQYTTTSKRLAEQLRAILLNFGIITRLDERDCKPDKLVKVHHHAYDVMIDRIEMVNKFYTNIGFRFERKQSRYLPETAQKFHGFKYDVIPFSADAFRELKKKRIIDPKEYTGLPLEKKKPNISRKMLLDVKERYAGKYNLEGTFFDYVRDDIIWAQISELTPGRAFVCDFSLNDVDGDEHAHSVVYQGFIGKQTPNGLNNFYKMWEDGVDEATATPHELESKYVRSTVLWNEVPGREAQWGIDEEARIGEQRFRQEYLCEFIGSATTLIDYKTLQILKPTKPFNIPGVPKDYSLRVFAQPINPQIMEKNDWTYVAALDTGFGMRQDYHVLQILLAKTSIRAEQVLVLSSNTVTVEDFCSMAASILKMYGNPPLTIEFNGGSGMTAHKTMFEKLGYDNLVNYDQYFRGIYSTNPIKTTAVMLLKLYVQRGYLQLKDEKTINELMSFTKLNQFTWGASGGNHDDHVTSLYWCVYFMESNWFPGKHEDLKFFDALEITFAGSEMREDMKAAIITAADPVALKEQRGMSALAAGKLPELPKELQPV